jgi:hypothetical protein
MTKSAAKKKSVHHIDISEMANTIVIDEPQGLVFSSEDELYNHFLPQIQSLEKDYFTLRSNTDIQDSEFKNYEDLLSYVLEDPDEIWENAVELDTAKVDAYIGHFTADAETVYYVALVYRTGETPSFVYLHFPSRELQLVERYRRGKLIYDRVLKEVERGAVEGDALSEGDDLAVGLYKAMLKLRARKDISEDDFKNFERMRETTIEEADEIWRTNDLSGNVLVSFIKDFSDDNEKGIHYIVVTIEDTPSSSHALLFSFPTKDSNLVDRYRHGENLQAEEVTQEASH